MKAAMKKLFCAILSLALVLSLTASASACTLLYVGSALTDDGAMIFGRSEDMSNDMNKLYSVAESGFHKEGEVYDGCYGFTWTFTHDSYGYTAFSDDNGEGVGNVCPDCGSDHAHTPYQAAGTNEKGVSMTATETLYPARALTAVDPCPDEGIEEAELTTVILSEAATAKEAVDLFLSILDEFGCNSPSGIIIADPTEAWYIENMTGHQYIAIKLNDSMVLSQPNMTIIGLVDLDDTENIIASADVIAVAKEAGTYVGDEEANTINYVLSYVGSSSASARMVCAMNFLDPAYADADADAIVPEDTYLISNVDADGNIVPLYTGIQLAAPFTIADAQNYFRCDNITRTGNLETHIFQIYDDSPENTVEWVGMDYCASTVFVPYYPILTKDVDASYKVSTAKAAFVTEAPESGVYYATTATQRGADGTRVTVDGFRVFPENWADSMYWAYDALSNILLTADLDEAQVAAVYDAVYAKQAEVNAAFEEAKAAISADADAATAWSMGIAADVHQFALDLVDGMLAD